MNIPPNDLKSNVLIAAGICVTAYLFFERSVLLFIPVFALVTYSLWKKGGGKMDAWEDDDPADWWKQGRKWEER